MTANPAPEKFPTPPILKRESPRVSMPEKTLPESPAPLHREKTSTSVGREMPMEQFEPDEKRDRSDTSEGTLERAIGSLTAKLKRTKKIKPTTIPQVRDALTVQVEKIMQERLEEAYTKLTPSQKQAFKIKGEETAWHIRQLLKATRVKIKKIFRLLTAWLSLLPGINRFYLEQEAKIKADKIIALTYFDKHR